ncbi:MAG: hypothetical protein WB764_28800 [Xanthobacteraceae bacterium]
MVLYYGGAGVTLSNKLGFTDVGLASGQTYLFPSGWYYVKPGPYSCLQVYDPVLAVWRGVGGEGAGNAQPHYISSDGNNYRLANLTGCAVGASVTNVGSGYTSAPTVSISGQNSIWRAVVGGAVSQTVTVSNGGANYTYPPAILFSSPPVGGIQATGYATLSGGALSTVTMVNQGGGYTSPPSISIVNDPRDTLGYGASAVCSLTGAKTIAGVICVDPGSGGLTSVPSLVFSGGGGSSAAATAIMCWSILSFTPTAGTGYTTSSLLSGLDVFPTAATTILNPAIQSQWVKTRLAQILMPASAGAPTATGAVFYDGGIYTSTPTALVTTGGELITQSATFAFGMGGENDVSHIWS